MRPELRGICRHRLEKVLVLDRQIFLVHQRDLDAPFSQKIEAHAFPEKLSAAEVHDPERFRVSKSLLNELPKEITALSSHVERDPAFREALLKQGVECLLSGDV